MPSASLSNRTLLRLAGTDRIAFLQGLMSNDMTALERGQAVYAALLSPQGKFLHDAIFVPDGETILVDVAHAHAEDLVKRLLAYRLRAHVTIEPEIGLSVAAWWDAPPPAQPGLHCITDPRTEALGWRVYGADAAQHTASDDYEAHRIRLGVPDGAVDMVREKSLLLEFDFERLRGVSFSKGCYVGQEVTARSKFRGQVRRMLCRVSADAPLPAAGAEIHSGSEIIGELRSSRAGHGLALIKTEWLERMMEDAHAGGVALRVHPHA